VIDLVARDEVALLAAMDGRRARCSAPQGHVLDTAGLPSRRSSRLADEAAAIITNPNVALILMMIGIYG
jgi:membrane-bound ClpP family serine protease